jgi:hypothetical protein
MYRQRPPGPPQVKNEPAGGASFPALRRVDSSFLLGKGIDDLFPKVGSPRGSSPARAVRVRRFRFLSYSSPFRGSGGSDSAFPRSFPWSRL